MTRGITARPLNPLRTTVQMIAAPIKPKLAGHPARKNTARVRKISPVAISALMYPPSSAPQAYLSSIQRYFGVAYGVPKSVVTLPLREEQILLDIREVPIYWGSVLVWIVNARRKPTRGR
jgi:hypothetical protein